MHINNLIYFSRVFFPNWEIPFEGEDNFDEMDYSETDNFNTQSEGSLTHSFIIAMNLHVS